MSKKRLIVDYSYDFQLLGICSSLKGYSLAWLINRVLKVKLTKVDDLVIEGKKGEFYSYQRFEQKAMYNELTLIKNSSQRTKSQSKKILPEFPHFDFVLMTKGGENDSGKRILESLQGITSIELTTLIPLRTLISKDNFIF